MQADNTTHSFAGIDNSVTFPANSNIRSRILPNPYRLKVYRFISDFYAWQSDIICIVKNHHQIVIYMEIDYTLSQIT